MALPAAIQAQLDQADQLVEGLAGAPTETQQDTSVPPAASATTVTQAQGPQAVPPVAPPREDWESKYKVLQGKYNAEVPRLQRQTQELTHTVAELKQKVADTPEPTRKVDVPPVDKQDADSYGADLMDAVDRRIRLVVEHAVADAIGRFRGEIAPVQQKVEQVAQQQEVSAEAQFWSRVTALVPDFHTSVDVDPSWIAFLNTAPEFSTDTYFQIAERAIAAGDADKIAKLVKVWRPQAPTAVELTPAPEDPPAPQESKPSLEAQVSPSTSKSSQAPPQQNAEIWTAARYEAALDPRNTRTMGAEAALKLIDEADKALAEGRVQWGAR